MTGFRHYDRRDPEKRALRIDEKGACLLRWPVPPLRQGSRPAGLQTLVDRPLAQLGLKRNVVLSLPFFVPAVSAIAQSDLVLTVPRRLAKITGRIFNVRVVEPPREIKAYPYFMAWHPRLSAEPAHEWFRKQIRVAAQLSDRFRSSGTIVPPTAMPSAS